MNRLTRYGWGMERSPAISPTLAMKIGVGRLRNLNTDMAADQDILDQEEQEESMNRQRDRFGGRGGGNSTRNGRFDRRSGGRGGGRGGGGGRDGGRDGRYGGRDGGRDYRGGARRETASWD